MIFPSADFQFESTTNIEQIRALSTVIIEESVIPLAEKYANTLSNQNCVILLQDKPVKNLPEWVDMVTGVDEIKQPEKFKILLMQAFRIVDLKDRNLQLQNNSSIIESRNQQLTRIGVALMAEKNIDSLLQMIMENAMKLTASDAGCLYLVEKKPMSIPDPKNYWADKQMRFKLTMNHSIKFNFTETVLQISNSTISGYAMLQGIPVMLDDVYNISHDAPYKHHKQFDTKAGYRTKSMLTLPMMNHHEQVIGALQLINKCPLKTRPIVSEDAAMQFVIPYDEGDLDFTHSLSSQASMAIDNARYETSIQTLFDGFIKASVTAIEARDPTTSGHSLRVAGYSTYLAECVNRKNSGPYGGIQFGDRDIRELKYAALLHDFGKIGVRENILTKAKKLFPDEMQKVRHRFDYLKRSLQLQASQNKMDLMIEFDGKPPPGALEHFDHELSKNLKEIDENFEMILTANEPSPIKSEVQQNLFRLSQAIYKNPHSQPIQLLTNEELSRLSIERGSLSCEERLEIESHVSHTYNFLSQIPWTADLTRVPEIAYGHHEKLDGTGYPRHLTAESIPLLTRLMTVCDIYDALTASDRPYKKAMPVDRALKILEEEMREGKLDQEVFQIFLDARVYDHKIGEKEI